MPLPLRCLPCFALLLILNSCNREPEAGPAMMPPPTGVTVAHPEPVELFDWEEMTGRLDAVQSVEIRPRVSGHIAEIKFRPGQTVKKGDVLFVIDRRPAKALLDAATAQAERAEAAAANAAREAKRAEELLASKAISNEEAETRRSKLAESAAAARSAVASKEAAALEYEFTEVTSPIDGVTSREMVTAGNYVSGVAGFTTLLTTVVSTDPVFAYADLDEAAFLRFSKLQAAKLLPSDDQGMTLIEMQLTDEENYPRKGHVESLDNRITASTGSITLRAVFPNPDSRLKPGMYARLRLPGSERYKAFLIAEDAIQTNQNLKYVYVVDANGAAQIRPVELGARHLGKRVLRNGVNEADQVIINGAKKVNPTMPVTIVPATPPAP